MTLASADKPEPDYSIIPAVPDVEGGKVPVARKKHAACAFNVCVAVFGGVDESDQVFNEDATIWLYNTAKSAWETLEPAKSDEAAPQPRSGAGLFNLKNNLVLYGGHDKSGEALKDVWMFDYVEKAWSQRPHTPVWSSSAALADGVLYLVSGNDNMGGDLHFLPLMAKREEQKWQTIPFPTNSLAPGPRARHGGGLLPVTTGYGRHYLTYMFGARQSGITDEESDEKPPPAVEATPDDVQYYSDMWIYQLPSAAPEAKITTNIMESLKPAKIKDVIRGSLGFDSGKHSWTEAEVLPPTDLEATAGKVHPGPRGFFGCDVMEDGRSLVVWGGVNAKGEKEGDGWVIKLG